MCQTNELNETVVELMKDLVSQINRIEKTEIRSYESSDQSYDYHLRGIIGTGSSENPGFSNMSLHFLKGSWGIGFSDFFLENTSTAGEEYELHNQSVDVSYTFGEDYTFSLGAGFIVSGEAKSSTLNLESTDVSGYRAMGLLGTNFGRWEALGGYQYSSFEYKNFSTTKNLTLSGGLMVFGIGMGF